MWSAESDIGHHLIRTRNDVDLPAVWIENDDPTTDGSADQNVPLFIQTEPIWVIPLRQATKRPPLSQLTSSLNREGTERASKSLSHQQCLPIRGETDAIRVLEIGNNPADKLA